MSEYIGGFISPSHISSVGTSKVSLKKKGWIQYPTEFSSDKWICKNSRGEFH